MVGFLDPITVYESLRAPAHDVEATWPLIVAALLEFKIDTLLTEIAAAATIHVETARLWKPINEFGNTAYFTKLYENNLSLGNVLPGDGDKFHGRGLIQVTGRDNYRDQGTFFGVDLENNPDLALDPTLSARILARFFARHNVNGPANTQDWRTVRRRVNGGYNGWVPFMQAVDDLLEASGQQVTAILPPIPTIPT